MPVVDVDERGRVVIPQEVREATGIQPGGKAVVEVGPEGEVVIRPALPMREALRRLKAAIAAIPREGRGPREDPLKAKEMWTSDVPARYRR